MSADLATAMNVDAADALPPALGVQPDATSATPASVYQGATGDAAPAAQATGSEPAGNEPAVSSEPAGGAGAIPARNALEASIASKGDMSYYHAHKDGNKSEAAALAFTSTPRLLEKVDGAAAGAGPRRTAITQYAWSDGKASVSVYVDFVGVGALPEESVTVKNTDTSVELAITSADGKAVHLLKLAPLYDKINKVEIKRKADQVVLKLSKATQFSWWQLIKRAGGGYSYDDDYE